MKPKLAALKDAVTVADGAWATELLARGVPANVPSSLANLAHADTVVELGAAYVEAGARLLTTNTFAANRYTIEQAGLDTTVAELNAAGVELARRAVAESDVLVIGAMSPSGKILTVSEASEDELLEAFGEQAEALADAGADAIVLETFSELAEILLALRAVKTATKLPVIASMSFDSGPQRTQTIMGARAEDCAAALDDAGADVVGCNCGTGINTVLPAVVALRGATELPLWVKPSSGLPELEDGRAVYRQTPEQFTAIVPTLIDAGANILGGCCGTGPEHIRRLFALVGSRRRRATRKKPKQP